MLIWISFSPILIKLLIFVGLGIQNCMSIVNFVVLGMRLVNQRVTPIITLVSKKELIQMLQSWCKKSQKL